MTWEARADLVVVGSGVAGLTAAVEAHGLGLRVLVITKAAADEGNTRWAQGGVAVMLPGERDDGDTVTAHVRDTLAAGGGLCERDAVEAILAGGAAAVTRLRELGAVFDPGTDGHLARAREGGHSAFRVVHAGGDATGAEIERALLTAARDNRVALLDNHIALDTIRTPLGTVVGLQVLDAADVPGIVRASAVLLATGGVGQLYQATSNPEVATADGLALALRAGAPAVDVEFVQFHPTVLYTGRGARGRCPLVTEALRGEGAVLVDATGSRVMSGVHPLEDLAPRDIVSAAITRRMAEKPGGVDGHVFLDATGLDAALVRRRFPTVLAACAQIGVDPTTEPIPVTPAAHFACGGVAATVDGRTGVIGLYAAGEVARTGLHGANRLASNSLLEGLVVGARSVRAVAADLAAGILGDPAAGVPAGALRVPVADRDTVQSAMTWFGGMDRDADGLAAADALLTVSEFDEVLDSPRRVEDAALTLAARAVLAAAAVRTESRGCHVRSDFPHSTDSWRRSVRVRLDAAGYPEAAAAAATARRAAA